MVSASRSASAGLSALNPIFSVADMMPAPMLSVARPFAHSSSARISIAIIAG